MEKKLYDLQIDEEFESTARALFDNERGMLSDDIKARGCIYPIIVWNNTIIDGHNRYRICHENNIPFGIEEVQFTDRTDAIIWIITNQLCRRNLTPYEKCEMVIRMETDLKKLAEERRRESISKARKTGEKLPPSPKTRDILSKMAGVSPRTFDKARVIVRDADEFTKKALRSGNKKISTVYTDLTKKEKTEGTDSSEEKGGSEKPYMSNEDIKVPDSEPKKENTETMHEPPTHLEQPFEVPSSLEEPEKTPRPFQFVRDQVWFSVENMLKELKIGLNWLRTEDADKTDVLLEILDDAFERAERMIKEEMA